MDISIVLNRHGKCRLPLKHHPVFHSHSQAMVSRLAVLLLLLHLAPHTFPTFVCSSGISRTPSRCSRDSQSTPIHKHRVPCRDPYMTDMPPVLGKQVPCLKPIATKSTRMKQNRYQFLSSPVLWCHGPDEEPDEEVNGRLAEVARTVRATGPQ